MADGHENMQAKYYKSLAMIRFFFFCVVEPACDDAGRYNNTLAMLRRDIVLTIHAWLSVF